MFKITRNDLAKKTDFQLAALFQEVVKGIIPTSTDYPAAQSLLARIVTERAKLSREVLCRMTDTQLTGSFNRAVREIGSTPRRRLVSRRASSGLQLTLDELAL